MILAAADRDNHIPASKSLRQPRTLPASARCGFAFPAGAVFTWAESKKGAAERAPRETVMRFGIFYEISIPRPWGPETERKVYDNCIEQSVLADELGFDHVWAVEP